MPACPDACYPWLTDFLCDYVDGTMEPQARAMFEECLTTNPELQAHVVSLTQARTTLGRYGRHVEAPTDLHRALHARLSTDCRCAQAYAACRRSSDEESAPSMSAIGVSALVAVLMVSALFAVSATFDAEPKAAPAVVERPPIPSATMHPLMRPVVGNGFMPASLYTPDSTAFRRAFSR